MLGNINFAAADAHCKCTFQADEQQLAVEQHE